MTPMRPVDFLILLSLAEGERHGYGMLHEIEALSDGEVRLDAGNLYRSLKRLLESDLIERAKRRAAKGRRGRAAPVLSADDPRKENRRRRGPAHGIAPFTLRDREASRGGRVLIRLYRLLLLLYPERFRTSSATRWWRSRPTSSGWPARVGLRASHASGSVRSRASSRARPVSASKLAPVALAHLARDGSATCVRMCVSRSAPCGRVRRSR